MIKLLSQYKPDHSKLTVVVRLTTRGSLTTTGLYCEPAMLMLKWQNMQQSACANNKQADSTWQLFGRDIPTRLRKAAIMVGRAKAKRPKTPVSLKVPGYFKAG